MLIGSLFTLAGYFLATVINTQPPNAHAQEKNNVFDKIVCKELEVVNDTGKKLLRMGEADGGSGFILVYNKEEMAVVGMDGIYGGEGAIVIGNQEGKITVAMRAKTDLGTGGKIEVKNFDGKNLVTIGSKQGRPNDGIINVYNHKREWRSISKD